MGGLGGRYHSKSRKMGENGKKKAEVEEKGGEEKGKGRGH